jgi:hypothetical protein
MVRRRPDKFAGPRSYELFRLRTARDASDRLESWKEIAAYLKREVRTVQRWEKKEGLPVHRHQHDERASVYAYKSELDAWWNNDHSRLETDQEREEVAGQETAEPLPALKNGNEQLAAPEGNAATIRYWPHWWVWVLVVVVAAVASAVTIYVLESRRSHQQGFLARNSVLIASFENRTGDPVFDGTLRQGLAAQLDQSPLVHIVSDQQIARALRLMRQPAGARLTQDLARQVCKRMGDAAVLDGSIAQIGSEYSLVLEAVNCSTGESLARVQAVAKDKNHVLEALGSVAASIRSKLGKSLASIRKFNDPLKTLYL